MMPKHKPRIAYVLQDFHIGGMESIIYRVASTLRDDFDFYFVACHVPDILPKFHKVGTAVYIGQNWWALRNYLKKQKIDLVQYGNVRWFADAALAAGVPVVIERTDGLRSGAALRPKKGIDGVIASTKGTIEPISKLIDRGKIDLIYNGIDLDKFRSIEADRLGFSPNDVLIGRVSRFTKGKNIAFLIDAVRALHEKYPYVRLVLVGGNSKMPQAQDEESMLREQAAGLEDHVVFTGYVDDPSAIIKGFDIGTCVSRPNNEGIPNSLLESMACGQPVVATCVDDIPELVVHEENGLLIEDNDLDGVVNALERLITDGGLRKALGQAGYLRIKRDFNLSEQIDAYAALYQRYLRSSHSRYWRGFYYSIILVVKMVVDKIVPAPVYRLYRRGMGKMRLILKGAQND